MKADFESAKSLWNVSWLSPTGPYELVPEYWEIKLVL
ncbi:hypothetical protein ERY430_60260 [Erythrobacter sp. EC-HK427]|nr:hypothetical protein ERY430_60260 [Erythrobacter sp. EC-HK427]